MFFERNKQQSTINETDQVSKATFYFSEQKTNNNQPSFFL